MTFVRMQMNFKITGMNKPGRPAAFFNLVFNMIFFSGENGAFLTQN